MTGNQDIGWMAGRYPQTTMTTRSSTESLGISRMGRWALALFGLNTALLFFPPIPPYVKGSLWSYLLKTAVIVLAALEVHRLGAAPARRWGALAPRRRWAWGMGAASAFVAVGLIVRWSAPDLFARSIAEVGPWETVSTACYACGSVLLWRASRLTGGDVGRHLRLLAAGLGLLLLEETDYGGVFGGIIGRVDGVYVGSLHDLVTLASRGQIPTLALLLLTATVVVVTFLLALHGYLRPRLLRSSLLSSSGGWLALGLLVLLVAGLGEAGLLGPLFVDPSMEEVVEVSGTACIAAFALEVSSRAVARSEREGPELEGEEDRGPVRGDLGTSRAG